MSWSGLLLFVGVYFAAVASPGPGVALVVARALGRGLSGLPWFIAGFVAGDLVMLSLACLGLAVLAQTWATAFLVVRWLGAAYLLFMAWKLWSAPVVEADARPGAENGPRAFLSSFALTLGNPKVIIFFVSIMPLVVDLHTMSAATFATLAALIVAIIAPVLTGYALLANRARRLFRSVRSRRAINRVTGGAMAGVAVAVATR